MADDANTLDIVIRTTAELEGARAVEAQLERDIVRARELGEALPAEAKEVVEPGNREAMDAGTPTAGAPSRGQDIKPPADDKGGAASEDEESTDQEPDATSENNDPPEAAREEAQKSSDTTGDRHPLTLPSSPMGERETKAGADGSARALPAGAGTFQIENGFESQADAQAQAMLAAGAQMRAALERNGRATVLLLTRTLQLMEEQNRQLDTIERRVTELAGQIKSLKNR